MGALHSSCFGNRNNRADDYKVNEQVDAVKTYSWDKRDAVDPRDYTFDALRDRVSIKPPGSIRGQQFIIQNCQGCSIFLLDHSATVTIDDCIDCNILIGPCKGSVFVRDCRDCRMIIACQQYRSRDCKNIDTYLLCQTQPIIESSTEMRFGCLQLSYDHLREQLNDASLSIFNNNWSKIHDFTPPNNGRSYSYSPEAVDQLEAIGANGPPDHKAYNVRCSAATSLVPLTLGKRPRPFDEGCFCLLFPVDEETEVFITRCLDLVAAVSEQGTRRLVWTASVRMAPSDAERLTGAKGVLRDSGDVVAMDWCGQGAADACRRHCRGTDYVVDKERAKTVSKEFLNFVDMQHGV